MISAEQTVRIARWFRRWLWLYPPAFRRRYGDDMTACFLERYAEDTGSRHMPPRNVWRRAIVNVVRMAAIEWRRSSLTRGSRPLALRGDSIMETLWHDLRYAARSLRRQPAYAWFVVLTLAVGIGASTGVFSVVNGVLLRPLAYPESDRLVAINGRFLPESGFDFESFPLSNPEYLDYRSSMKSLEDMAAYAATRVTVGTDGSEPERVIAALVTPNMFSLLGQTVAVGRTFEESEGLPGTSPTVILSDGYWRARFGGAADIVGQAVRLGGVTHTVVGVARPGFAFPDQHARLWMPLVIDPAAPGGRSSHDILAIGRLAQTVTLADLEAESSVLMAQWKADYPAVHTGHFLFAQPALEYTVGDLGEVLWPLLAATLMLLSIVCANVSSVTLAHVESRVREMAVRTALGATRWKLIRLRFIESLLLSLAGGLGGIVLATGAVKVLVSLEGTGLPRLAELTVDWRVLAFGASLALVSSVVVGLMPAWKAASRRGGTALRHDTRTSSADVSRLRFRRTLVAAEVALTVVLVIGAGLMVRSLSRVISVDPGFASDDVVMAIVSLPASGYPESDQVQAFFDDVLERVSASPAVTSASAANYVPFYLGNGLRDFEIEGRPPVESGQPSRNGGLGWMRPGFFELMGIPLKAGRTFTDADRSGTEPVVVINEALASKFFGDGAALGQHIRIASNDPLPWMRVVGVVGNVRDGALELPTQPMYYTSHRQTNETAQSSGRLLAIALKTDGAPDVGTAALRAIVRDKDASLPLASVQTLDAAIGDALARRRFATTLFGGFAAIGLLLGATGVYGVLAFMVAQRSKEIGIRRALGASSKVVAKITLSQALWPVATGIVGGLVVASAASIWIESQLFGVAATDAVTYGTVIAGVGGVAVLACLIPLRRALRIDPAVALRQ
jgi:putative ABC transport system permease protein